MSTSIVHVLTVIGKAAGEVESVCEELRKRRVKDKSRIYGTDDWSASDHHEIETLCTALIGSAYQLPVIYYAQYVDAYSVGDCQFALLPWPDGKRRQLCASRFGLVYYPSAIGADLLSEIHTLRKRKAYRTQREDRWYVNHVREAMEAALWLKSPFVVIGISQCLGPSRRDEDVTASLKKKIHARGPSSGPPLVESIRRGYAAHALG